MEAIRELKKVTGRKITIDLPNNFSAKEIEIIILPHTKINSVETSDEWKKDFLSISQWEVSEDETRIKSWSIKEY